MECTLIVPHGTDISQLEREYPDLANDELDDEGDVYFIGKPNGEDEEVGEWLTYEETIEFCGFSEGLIEGADAVIDGNGSWAMGMLQETDFSRFSISEEDKTERKRLSDIWHLAFERGKAQRTA